MLRILYGLLALNGDAKTIRKHGQQSRVYKFVKIIFLFAELYYF